MSDDRSITYRDIVRDDPSKGKLGDKQTPSGKQPGFMQWPVPPAVQEFTLRLSKKELEKGGDDAVAAVNDALDKARNATLRRTYECLTDVQFARRVGSEQPLAPIDALKAACKQLGGNVVIG